MKEANILKTKGEKTAGNIIDIAIAEFGKNGYAGTSISKIAKDSDLKKSSIYTHFSSKEELFIACINVVASRRIDFLNDYLDDNKNKNLVDILYGFLMLYDDLGGEDSDAYFHERFAYFPPEELKEKITNFTSNYLIVQVKKILKPFFVSWADKNNINENELTDSLIAFLSIYDGLIIERLIGGRKKFRYRLKHTWHFYSSALREYEIKNRNNNLSCVTDK